MTLAHDRAKAARHKSPSNGFMVSIIEGRKNLLPGFKRFRRATRIQAMQNKLATQAELLTTTLMFTQMFYKILSEGFAKEDNWVVEEKHAEGCDLNNTLLLSKTCSCTPLQNKIWNGEPEIFNSTHAALGEFERVAMGRDVSTPPVIPTMSKPPPSIPSTNEPQTAGDEASPIEKPDLAGQA